ncbi:hypothetical protein ACV3KS_06030 [Clostridium perfringens]|uniref:hypothetical protein n=1 Tax=Clostridium perfringens TaxID=1502 RepID=UPI001CCF2716|nr:hypothetical protein [Clostridium perfringens]MDK0546042.1 hypothetical protein [Clostridium perfringens]UBK62160.1 hypothetical protein KLF30_07560 [Clostridium perfringens]
MNYKFSIIEINKEKYRIKATIENSYKGVIFDDEFCITYNFLDRIPSLPLEYFKQVIPNSSIRREFIFYLKEYINSVVNQTTK